MKRNRSNGSGGGLPLRPIRRFSCRPSPIISFANVNSKKRPSCSKGQPRRPRPIIDCVNWLAKIYVVDLKDAKRGDACMARMVESNPADGGAFRERARYYLLRGADPRMKDADRVKLSEKALKDAQKAAELSPGDAECVRTALEAAGRLRKNELMEPYARAANGAASGRRGRVFRHGRRGVPSRKHGRGDCVAAKGPGAE